MSPAHDPHLAHHFGRWTRRRCVGKPKRGDDMLPFWNPLLQTCNPLLSAVKHGSFVLSVWKQNWLHSFHSLSAFRLTWAKGLVGFSHRVWLVFVSLHTLNHKVWRLGLVDSGGSLKTTKLFFSATGCHLCTAGHRSCWFDALATGDLLCVFTQRLGPRKYFSTIFVVTCFPTTGYSIVGPNCPGKMKKLKLKHLLGNIPVYPSRSPNTFPKDLVCIPPRTGV